METSARTELDGQTTILPGRATGTQARQLRQPWLNVLRGLWVIVLVVNLAVLIGGTVYLYKRSLTICNLGQDATCGEDMRTTKPFADAIKAQGLSIEFFAGFTAFPQLLVGLVFILVAVFLFWQRSYDWLALLASFAFIVFGTYIGGGMANLFREINPAWWPLGGMAAFVGIVLIGAFGFLFPDGHFYPGWMRWVLVGYTVWFFVGYVLIPTNTVKAIILLPIATIAYSQIDRYRHTTDPLKRQQTKWFVFGVVISIFTAIFTISIWTVLAPLFYYASTPIWVGLLVGLLSNLGNVIVPITVAIAILHYRIWDVDFLINRTLVYGALTALLVVVFGISLMVVSRLFEKFNGGQQSGVAIGATALVFGLLFQPSHRALQRFVDRRFYGIRIKYQKPLRDGTPVLPANTRAGLTHFGVYEVIEPIGRGGMAEVYRGRHATLNKPVAIKVLPQTLVKDADFRKRFEREAQTVAALKHPNIVEVFDFGEADGTPYMVMEFVSGQDLSDFLQANGRLELSQELAILREVASALDYAHNQGIVHRDIKASNIMLEPITATGQAEKSYRAVLMDFGIAKIVGGGTRLTQHNMMGTLDYIAPEQIQAAAEVDGRADVYALGVLTYQLLIGELPFKTNNPGALLLAHLQQPPPDPRSTLPDLPEKVAKAILRALAKSPTERYATAGEFIAAMA